MTYGLSLAKQTENFLFAFGFGFVLGIIYDFLFVIRSSASKRKTVTVICDVIFIFVSSFLSFFLLLIISDGQIRFYILLGELLGFAVYYFSVGVFIAGALRKTVGFFKRIFGIIKKSTVAVFKVILRPFFSIFHQFLLFLVKIGEKMRKNAKRYVKNSKYHLQVDNVLLYNLKEYKSKNRKVSLRENKKGRKNTREKN